MLQKFNFIFLSFECVLGPGAALGSKEYQVVNWEIPLGQYFEELLTYGAACTYNGYFHLAVVLR